MKEGGWREGERKGKTKYTENRIWYYWYYNELLRDTCRGSKYEKLCYNDGGEGFKTARELNGASGKVLFLDRLTGYRVDSICHNSSNCTHMTCVLFRVYIIFH